MSETYSVVFIGELRQGFDTDKIIEVLNKTFKISSENAKKLLETSNEVVLKEGLDAPQVEMYQNLLENIGLVIRIDREEVDNSSSTLSPEPTRSSDTEAIEARENPFRTPKANLLEPEEGKMLVPTSVPANHGLAWLASGGGTSNRTR